MFIKNFSASKKRVLKLLQQKPKGMKGKLLPIVKNIHEKKKAILTLAKKYSTPFYLIDDEALQKSIGSFVTAFRAHIPECQPFYAVKSNHHPHILQSVLKKGFGLDVSSGRELELALKEKAQQILFSGPGKTDAELTLALRHAKKIIIHIDSFGELRRLARIAKKMKKNIRAGVRIFTKFQQPWSKFGIPLEQLKAFYLEAKKYPEIQLQGIQFHLSWNRNPDRYEKTIEELGKYLKKKFTPEMRKTICFIDIGGGFYPNRSEGYYPWTTHSLWALNGGGLLKMANAHFGEESRFLDKYFITESVSLDAFAMAIAEAIGKHLQPIVQCAYFTEPGRIICNNAMHIVLRVVDVKKPNHVITDGGVNASGWEYGEHFYFPLVNLTHPSLKEVNCTLYGSLCTPHDIWGYYCYATRVKEDDIIVVPNQGAYRYVLAQNFIKPIPNVYLLKNANKSKQRNSIKDLRVDSKC